MPSPSPISTKPFSSGAAFDAGNYSLGTAPLPPNTQFPPVNSEPNGEGMFDISQFDSWMPSKTTVNLGDLGGGQALPGSQDAKPPAAGGATPPQSQVNTQQPQVNQPGTQGTSRPSILHPEGASPEEIYTHYAEIIKKNGGRVNPDGRATVLGLRGITPSGETNPGTNLRELGYNDTIVVLKPDKTAVVMQGNTIANITYQNRRRDLGSILSGQDLDVRPNGPYFGSPSFHVTKNGSGNIPAVRDFDGNGTFSPEEFNRARRNGTTQSEILFHPGARRHNGSMGCQTLPPSIYRDFVAAVGGNNARFNYVLVDANKQK